MSKFFDAQEEVAYVGGTLDQKMTLLLHTRAQVRKAYHALYRLAPLKTLLDEQSQKS